MARPSKKMKKKPTITVTKQRFDTPFLFPILSKLPVKSLLRFMSVCRSWNALIRSSDFVAHHRHCHDTDDNNRNSFSDNLLIYIPELEYWKPKLVCTLVSGSHHSHNAVLPLSGGCRTIGVCEGLICLRKLSHLYIWNPLVKSLKKVPPPSSHSPYDPSFGFGLARQSNDYRIVKVDCSTSFKVEMYSLASNSWKSIDHPFKAVDNLLDPVYLEGSIYWLAKSFRKYDVILRFDMEEKIFEVVAAPTILMRWSSLVVANGSLVLFQVECRNMQVRTWILKKESSRSWWTSVETHVLPKKDKKNRQLRRTTWAGHIVLVGTQDQRLFVYDYDVNVGFSTLRDLKIYRTSNYFSLIPITKETLCLLDQQGASPEA